MVAVACVDAVADNLARDLHRLLVVVHVGRAEVRDGRVVDERAVGQLRDIDGIAAVCGLVSPCGGHAKCARYRKRAFTGGRRTGRGGRRSARKHGCDSDRGYAQQRIADQAFR